MDENINTLLEIDNSQTKQILIPYSIGVLRFFAWFYLVISMVISFILWSTLSKGIIEDVYYTYIEKVVDLVKIGLGIGIFLHGIFICALFLVIAQIAESLIYIQHNTKK